MFKNGARQPKDSLTTQRGFTLIEMAVVLVIIGLILGGISIGKDLQRDAEYDKIKQKFIDQWAQAYNVYYQRTGTVVGDSQVAPQMMVNGVVFTAASGGDMSTATEPNAVCQNAAHDDMSRSFDAGTDANLHDAMDRQGIRMPPGRAEGSEDRYVYLDTNGNPQELQVCFQWNKPGTPSNSGNVMVLSGLTPDLARAIDQMVDGKPDSREGLFRQEGIDNGTAGVPGIEWTKDNTDEIGGADGQNFDEDQVAIVVAHYKMNQ